MRSERRGSADAVEGSSWMSERSGEALRDRRHRLSGGSCPDSCLHLESKVSDFLLCPRWDSTHEGERKKRCSSGGNDGGEAAFRSFHVDRSRKVLVKMDLQGLSGR